MPNDLINDTVTTCPFCSLLCEDMPAFNTERKIACSIARHGYDGEERYRPQINGRKTDVETACRKAADILSAARLPLISGLGTDVRGIRAALLLAERSSAIVDHAGGGAVSDYVRVLCEEGWLGATLSEVRNRADLIVCLGCDFTDHHPRYIERISGASPAKFVFIGNQPPQKEWFADNKKRSFQSASYFPAPLPALAEVAGTLAALAQGTSLLHTKAAGRPLSQWQSLVDQMRQAQYVVLCWQTARLPAANRESIMRSFARLTRSINETTRCAMFPLGGDDGGTTALQVSLWQNGYPLRVAYQAGTIQYDPWRYDTNRLLASAEADALLWISTLSGNPPPSARAPRIFIGRADRPPPKVDVYIPAATPGLHCDSVLFRGDGIVPLPVRAHRPDEKLSTVESILYQITNALSVGSRK